MAWVQEVPNKRDVEGQPREESEDQRAYYWPRWRGSTTRIADLARTLDKLVGAKTEESISVRWSEHLTLSYSPEKFETQVDQDRLRCAELIQVSVAGSDVTACVRFSKRHGEPGGEIVVTGVGREKAFDQLKETVELGRWRPWSSERLTAAIFVVVQGAFYALATGLVSPEGLAFLVAAGATVLYVMVTLLIARALLPPLEIRPSGTQGRAIAGDVFRWAIPGIPAVLALLALVGVGA